MTNSHKRTVIYIDGSNFYFSIKKTFNCKVDIEKFCKKLVCDDKLIKISYYIAPVNRITNPKDYIEQQKFFDIIKKIDKLNIILGRLEKRKRDGRIFYVEKANDVNLALDLVLDAQRGIYDKAYLISNDGDFSGAATFARNFNKEIVYVAVGNRKTISHHLKKVCSSTIKITGNFIKDIELDKNK